MKKCRIQNKQKKFQGGKSHSKILEKTRKYQMFGAVSQLHNCTVTIATARHSTGYHGYNGDLLEL